MATMGIKHVGVSGGPKSSIKIKRDRRRRGVASGAAGAPGPAPSHAFRGSVDSMMTRQVGA
jgi:hypothetical protein